MGLTLLLVVGGIIVAVLLLRHGSHRQVVLSPEHDTGTSTSSTSTTIPATTTTTGASLSLQEAQSVNALLEGSSDDRQAIVAATSDIGNCGNLSQDQMTLTSAAQSRQALLGQLTQLDLSQLPGYSSLVPTLTAAWQASIQSDNSYAAWAGDLEQTGCSGQASTDDSNFKAARVSDAQATSNKRAFVAAWNPIAAAYGLPQYTESEI